MAQEMFDLDRLPARPPSRRAVGPQSRWFPCFPVCAWQEINLLDDERFEHSREARACLGSGAVLPVECSGCGSILFLCMHGTCTKWTVFSDDTHTPHTGPATQHARQHRGSGDNIKYCCHGCGSRWRAAPRGARTDNHIVHERRGFCVNPARPLFGDLPKTATDDDRAARDNLERNTRALVCQFKLTQFPALVLERVATLVVASRRRYRRPRLPNELWHLVFTEFLNVS
jgi:hypothetical protein